MCILLNVKKHEKTFALNVDIFIFEKNKKNWLTFVFISYIIIHASETNAVFDKSYGNNNYGEILKRPKRRPC